MEELLTNRASADDEPPAGGGKRAVHVKFKLSKDAVAAKETLADRWDRPPKEIAELAVQLTASFLEDEDEETRHRFIEKAQEQPRPLARGTHVVSRATKSFLESMAGDLDLTRDQCFDACLRLAHSIVQFLHEAQLERHDALIPALHDLLRQARSIEADLQEEAPDIDPLKPAVTAVRRHIERIVDDVEAELERNHPLDRSHEFV